MDIKNMIEIELLVKPEIIKETLTRIGIGNRKQRILYPTCYLYPNYEKFYIVHFKELFLLSRQDGYNDICDDDIERKNSVIFCLQNWELIKVKNPELINPHTTKVFVLPFKLKTEWEIQHKFNMNNINLLNY